MPDPPMCDEAFSDTNTLALHCPYCEQTANQINTESGCPMHVVRAIIPHLSTPTLIMSPFRNGVHVFLICI